MASRAPGRPERHDAGAWGSHIVIIGSDEKKYCGDCGTLLKSSASTSSLELRDEIRVVLAEQFKDQKVFELEVLEKVADQANLTVVLGEGGLADRVVKLL